MSHTEQHASRPKRDAISAAFLGAGFAILAFALLAPSCSSDKIGPIDQGDAGALDATPAPDAPAPDAVIIIRDVGIVPFHDAGAPQACNATCDCPQGLGCVNGTCRVLGAPVYCCSKGNCPTGQACLAENDRPSMCPSPDGGVVQPGACERPDASLHAGPDAAFGSIGSYCEGDFECDQSQGFTCWQRFMPPYIWGYCTLVGCTGGCPAGSMCIQFNIPPPDGPVTGCMQTCNVNTDCRPDAYCFFIPGAGFNICLPNCRDDILDCAPRDGTNFCDPLGGECQPNMCHPDMGGESGAPCTDNRDCAEGNVCMTQTAWGFPGGLCTRVCSTLPEAAPCESGETCQMFAGVGLCFKNCVGNACPSRPGAICQSLEPGWLTPGCVP